MVDQLAPHVKTFESYPGYQFAEGNWALSHVWNGDARQGFNSFEDPSRYAWGLGAPDTELWMDNWTIVKGATHPEAAYAFINFILDPANSLQDLQFHGYNTGIKGRRGGGDGSRHHVPGHDLLHRRAGGHVPGWRGELGLRSRGGDLQQGQGCGGRIGRAEIGPTRIGDGARGSEDPGSSLRAGAPRLDLVRVLLRAPAPVDRLLLVRLQAEHLPPDRDRQAVARSIQRRLSPAHSCTSSPRRCRSRSSAPLLCLLIGFPFAYWLATRVTARWRGVLLGLVIVPFFVNFLIRTIGWLILLAPSGPVSTLLQNWGLRSEPLHLLQTRGAVQLGVVYNYLALMIFPLFVTLDRLDPAMREASKDLGASRWKTFRQVTLPLAAPGDRRRIAPGLHPAVRRLHHCVGAWRSEGEHGGSDGRDPIQHRAQNWALGAAQAVILIIMILATVAVFALLGLLDQVDRSSAPQDHPACGDGVVVVSAVASARVKSRRDPVSVALRSGECWCTCSCSCPSS